MAVKAKEALNEEDSSYRESSYEEEEDSYESQLAMRRRRRRRRVEKEEAEGANVSEKEELRELHKRISQTSYPLMSAEALGVLHTALLSLKDKHSNLLHDDSLLSPLLLQLQSLETLLPPTQGDKGSTSCVITGALNYLEQLSRMIQGLQEGAQEFTSLSGCTSKDKVSPDHVGMAVKVESLSNSTLHIQVHCKKREGLLSRLILSFDTLGLVIDQMDISCDDVLQMEVITTQVDEKVIDHGMVKKTLLKIIFEGFQKITKI